MGKFFDFLRSLFSKKETIVIVPVEKKAPPIPEPSYENEWKVIKSVPPEDTDGLVRVMYKNELGLRYTNHCMAVFESPSKYKLVAPWLGSGKELLKGNITEFQMFDASKTVNKNYKVDE